MTTSDTWFADLVARVGKKSAKRILDVLAALPPSPPAPEPEPAPEPPSLGTLSDPEFVALAAVYDIDCSELLVPTEQRVAEEEAAWRAEAARQHAEAIERDRTYLAQRAVTLPEEIEIEAPRPRPPTPTPEPTNVVPIRRDIGAEFNGMMALLGPWRGLSD